MTIKLLGIGKTDDPSLQALTEVYINRLQFYNKVYVELIPDIKNSKNLDENQQKQKEGELLLNKISASDFVVLLDENGKQYSSEEFSVFLQKRMNSGIKQLIFIIGGENHRFGLFDMIMLKDNHIDFAGGITSAIEKTKQYLKENNLALKIVVEARDMEEVKEILSCDGIYRILIDNFNYEETRAAVELIDHRVLTESSGGITLETVRKFAECGVDYVSSGALTHSISNMDLSLKAV